MHAFNKTDRILITGGTGFIGKRLAAKCLEYTPFVTCIGLSDSNNKRILPGVEFLFEDLSSKKEVETIFKGRRFDYVFNFSGYIDHTPYFKGGREVINAHLIGLMNVIDCIDKDKLKGFVQIGTSDEYGNNPAPQKETMREQPISPYSIAKVASSHFIQMLYDTERFPGTVLRFFLVYGPGQDDQRFLPQIIKMCLRNEKFKASEGKQLRDFCYIDDVVEAVVRSALSPCTKGQVINVASGIPVSIMEMIKRVVNIIGGGKPQFGAIPYRKGENMELYADISNAKRMINWMPVTSLEEGLNKTIEYYKNVIS